MNASPVVPVTVVALEITGAGGLIVITKLPVPVPPALTALNETVKVPLTVGVPLITPVDALILKPDGKPVAP